MVAKAKKASMGEDSFHIKIYNIETKEFEDTTIIGTKATTKANKHILFNRALGQIVIIEDSKKHALVFDFPTIRLNYRHFHIMPKPCSKRHWPEEYQYVYYIAYTYYRQLKYQLTKLSKTDRYSYTNWEKVYIIADDAITTALI